MAIRRRRTCRTHASAYDYARKRTVHRKRKTKKSTSKKKKLEVHVHLKHHY